LPPTGEVQQQMRRRQSRDPPRRQKLQGQSIMVCAGSTRRNIPSETRNPWSLRPLWEECLSVLRNMYADFGGSLGLTILELQKLLFNWLSRARC
jgi:hypothetical protein